jgi:hypothetical protein
VALRQALAQERPAQSTSDEEPGFRRDVMATLGVGPLSSLPMLAIVREAWGPRGRYRVARLLAEQLPDRLEAVRLTCPRYPGPQSQSGGH